MPAITLGLVEVEERLHVLRRRLNWLTLQHGAYLAASTVILVATALIVAGLRGSALTFRVTLCGGSLLSVAVITASVALGRRRWMDAHATAFFADRQARLTDRLATLIDPRLRARPSRLAPLLVAQTLAMGAEWRAERLVPRRVPRSLFVLLAALLALAATTFIARRTPAPSPPAQTASGAGQAPGGRAPLEPQPSLAPNANGDQPGAEADRQPPSDALMQAAPSDAGLAAVGAPADTSQPDTSPGSLPDRLQDAIRRAFHGQRKDDPQQVAARANENASDRREPRPGEAGEDEQRERAMAGPPNAAPQGDGNEQQKQTGQGKSDQQHAGQDQDKGGARDQNFDGSAPAAGTGSSPSGLMDAKDASPALGGEGAKTFKLTITSFLRAVEQKGEQRHTPGKPAGASASAGDGVGAPAALSPRQLNDDALRKAQIPPEYEDIVRRVYSLRGEQ
ncbi:MAG: hypothetical protein ACHQ4J_04340 [Candidatus Binatia bacterium]